MALSWGGVYVSRLNSVRKYRPTTNSSMDLMSESPNTVDKKLLDVLGIEITKKDSGTKESR